jgi:rSAM/selenodomain-associated transferase 1
LNRHGNAPGSSRRQAILPALAIFARSPNPGRAKTRLIPVLGPRGAAEFHAALVSDVIRKVDTLAGSAERYFFGEGDERLISSPLFDYRRRRQHGADLGERLERAFRQLLRRHSQAVIIGSDSPMLSTRTIRQAFQELLRRDAVLGPCPDGGFYLIGLRRLEVGLFEAVPWGTDAAFRGMHENLTARGFSCSILELVADVDRPEDVEKLKDELAQSLEAQRLAPSAWSFLKDFFVLENRHSSSGRSKGR